MLGRAYREIGGAMRIAGNRRTISGLASFGAMAALAGCIPSVAPPMAPSPPPQPDRSYPDYRQDVTTSPSPPPAWETNRSEEHTSELQSLMRISYAVFCLKKKNKNNTTQHYPDI